MARVISLHSFRGGTGKSNISANLAIAIAAAGKRVAIVDTDIQSPGIHALFHLGEDRLTHTLNDYLWGRCEISAAAYDVTPDGVKGSAFLVPASMKIGDISRVLHEGYDPRQLKDGFRDLISSLNIDYLLIDTHPGLNEETLLSIAISHVLILILRPDIQDYQGTSVTLEVARKLGVPQLLMVLNKALPEIAPEEYRQRLQETYNCQVGTVLPLAIEIARLGSDGIFLLQAPEHQFSRGIHELGAQVLDLG